MEDPAYTVALVVDPDFGNRLGALALEMPVWVADTPTNRAAAEILWKRTPVGISHAARGAITTFQVRVGESPSAWAIEILGDIDLHHGEFSHTPGYSVLEVIGTEATSDLRDALREYGLTELESRVGGFRVVAPRVA
jgi:hypothetical protein